MDKANAAEWLLRRVTDRVRASELVGDQLEVYFSADRLSFWIAIARLLLVFSWRTLVGIAVSPVGGILLAVTSFAFGRSLPVNTQGLLQDSTVFSITLYLLGVAVLLWAATVFSMVRFGWRSTMTITGLMASVLCSASFCFFWSPAFTIVLAVMWVSFFIFSASSAKRRRAFGILVGAVAAAWLTGFVLSNLPRDPHSTFGKWQGIAAVLLVPIVESSITMFLHKKFITSQSTEAL